MNPYKFQQTAIENLQKAFASLWSKEASQAMEIVLKAPTGSGKTFMTCKFIDSLQTPSPFLPQMDGLAFFWITFSDDLAMQSKHKFEDYFFPNVRNELVGINDCGDAIKSNAVLFVNWQKLSQKRGKDRLRLRRPTDENLCKEQGYYFDDIISNTHAAGRQIVMIIDESHTHVDTTNSQELIDFIHPKIILKVSATPFKGKDDENKFYALKGRGFAELVEIQREEVIAEGLIKEEIICQTEEDLKKYAGGNIDEVMLDLAIERRNRIKEDWTKIGRDINPLVLVQLPNDSDEIEDGTESKEIFTRRYLQRRGIDESKILTWTADKPLDKNSTITDDNNSIEYLLFKYAAGTGWDCPRAHVLVMFREIKSPTFHTQTLGRIVRMAVHGIDLSGFPMLRTGYLYTTYARNAVAEGVEPGTTNKQKVLTSQLSGEAKNKAVSLSVAYEMGELFAKSEIEREKQNVSEPEEQQKKQAETIEKVKTETKKIWVEEIKKINEATNTEANSEVIHTAKIDIAQKLENKIRETLCETEISSKEKAEIKEIVDHYVEAQIGKRDTELILDPALKSDFMTRSDYGDLGRTGDFQKSFKQSMDKFFDRGLFAANDETDKEKLEARGVDTTPSLKRSIMINTHFRFEDNETQTGENTDVEVSRNDVEKLFTIACFKILKESSIGNVARSWSTLREALRQWFRTLIFFSGDNSMDGFYRVFVKDIEKETNSVFRSAINKAIEEYKPVLQAFVRERQKESELQSQPFKIKTTVAYTTDYEIYTPSSKSMQQPFYLRKEYAGRNNEIQFIDFLEGNSEIESWMKNADSGKDSYSIRYYDSEQKRYRLFNPDWIVKYYNGDIGIFDTKGGFTASSAETKEKAEILATRIAELNEKSKFHYVGGIAIKRDGEWYYNCSTNYSYSPTDLTGWKDMNDLF